MRTLWIVMLGLCACKGHPKPHVQSFREGVEALCDVASHAPATGTYAERLAATNAWIAANITNPEAHQLGGIGGNKQALAAAAQQAGLSHCALVDTDMALQSFADAVKAACAAPPNDPAYFKSHVLNPEAAAMFEAVGDLPPARRIEKLRNAVGRANLGACPYLEKVQAAPAANVPTVTGLGLVELAPNAVSIAATDAGVVVAGKPVDRAKLAAAMTDLAAAKSTLTRVQLLVAPTLTAQVLNELVDAAARAGYKDLALVVNANGLSRAIPFTRSDIATGKGVRPTVAIDATTFRLSSADGSEGTAQQPKATVASPAQLAATLTELATRRWNGKRSDDDRWLYVTIDPATPIQRVADALAVVRATPDGGELFPRISLTR